MSGNLKELQVTRQERLAGLDGLRFAAAIGVMVAHYGEWLYPHLAPTFHLCGALSVNVFFVISGFVILRSARGAASARNFLFSRAKRLYPAYLICFVFSLAVFVSLHGSISPGDILVHLTMLPKLFGVPMIYGIYWTLSHEWMFYLMVAAAFYILKDYVIPVIAGWIILGLTLRYFDVQGPIPDIVLNDGLAPLFGAGMLIHLIRSGDAFAAKAAFPVLALALVSTGGAWYRAPVWSNLQMEMFYFLLCAFCVGLVALAATLRFSPLLQWLAGIGGAISYPLYLVHAPLADLIAPKVTLLGGSPAGVMAVCSLASVGVGFVVCRYLEAPMRNLLVALTHRIAAIPAAADGGRVQPSPPLSDDALARPNGQGAA